MAYNMGQIGAYVMIPFALAVPPIIGWFIGHTLDSTLNSGNWFTLIFIVIGFIAGGREVYRIIKRFSDEK